jgi:hypothetical protein
MSQDDQKKDLTSIVDLSKRMEEAGELPNSEDDSVLAEPQRIEKVDKWESLEEYAETNPPPEFSEDEFATSGDGSTDEADFEIDALASDDFPLSDSSNTDTQFPTSDAGGSDDRLTGLSSVIEPESGNDSSNGGFDFDSPSSSEGDEMPFDSSADESSSLPFDQDDGELARADAEIDQAMAETDSQDGPEGFPVLEQSEQTGAIETTPSEPATGEIADSNSEPKVPDQTAGNAEPLTAESKNDAMAPSPATSNPEIETPAAPAVEASPIESVPTTDAPPVSSDFIAKEPTGPIPDEYSPERIDGVETIEVRNSGQASLPDFPPPSSSEALTSAAATRPQETTFSADFSLLIEGRMDDYQQGKLKELLAEHPLGISIDDIQEQIETGRVLLPRLSEYAGIYFVQQLRDSNLRMKFGPSSAIYARSDSDEASANATDESLHGPKSVEPDLSYLSDPDGLAQTLPVVAGGPPDEWSKRGWLARTSVTSSSEWRTIDQDLTQSGGFQEVVDRLTLSLRMKAFYQGATGIAFFQIQTHPLSATEGSFRVVALGTLYAPPGSSSDVDASTTSSEVPPPPHLPELPSSNDD